jgi:hypothetical protein
MHWFLKQSFLGNRSPFLMGQSDAAVVPIPLPVNATECVNLGIQTQRYINPPDYAKYEAGGWSMWSLPTGIQSGNTFLPHEFWACPYRVNPPSLPSDCVERGLRYGQGQPTFPSSQQVTSSRTMDSRYEGRILECPKFAPPAPPAPVAPAPVKPPPGKEAVQPSSENVPAPASESKLPVGALVGGGLAAAVGIVYAIFK